MSAKFRLEPDNAPREVSVPTELKKFLAEDRKMRDWFGKLSFSFRRYLSTQITDVKSAEARRRRAEQTAELMLATMEGEREVPPILQAAFARDGRAREGWNLMTRNATARTPNGDFLLQESGIACEETCESDSRSGARSPRRKRDARLRNKSEATSSESEESEQCQRKANRHEQSKQFDAVYARLCQILQSTKTNFPWELKNREQFG